MAPDRPVADTDGAGRASAGGVVSTTCTTKVVGVATFPCASWAEQITVVFPSGKVDPDAGEHVTGSVPSTMSVAAGFVYNTAAPAALVASAVTSA